MVTFAGSSGRQPQTTLSTIVTEMRDFVEEMNSYNVPRGIHYSTIILYDVRVSGL